MPRDGAFLYLCYVIKYESKQIQVAMKNKLDFSLNYEAQFEISNIRLELDRGYEGDAFLYYRFDVQISCGERSSVIYVSQLMTFVDLEPPSEDIFPESDILRWRFYDPQNPKYKAIGSGELRFNDLSDIDKEILQNAVEAACESKNDFKQAYIKFWERYAQDQKNAALYQLANAERLKQKLDSFLRTIEES